MATLQMTNPTPAQQLDKTSSAVDQYLTLDDSDAFDHLVRICLKATNGLYVKDDFGRKAFIETFVLEFLAPYRGMTPDLIRSAARDGKFRYMANRCRSRFLNKIRDTNRARRRAVFVAYNPEHEYPVKTCPDKKIELPYSECDVPRIDRWQWDTYFNSRQVPDDAEFDLAQIFSSGKRPF